MTVGLIQLWMTENIPEGFLPCDGSEVSQTTYPELYALYQNKWGAAAVGQFKLPDFRGYFPRVFAGTPTQDPDAGTRTNRGDGTTGNSVGTKQLDSFDLHKHQVSQTPNGGSSGHVHLRAFTGNYGMATGFTGGAETRAKNIYIIPIVKY